jgi:hypothetical protein
MGDSPEVLFSIRADSSFMELLHSQCEQDMTNRGPAEIRLRNVVSLPRTTLHAGDHMQVLT